MKSGYGYSYYNDHALDHLLDDDEYDDEAGDSDGTKITAERRGGEVLEKARYALCGWASSAPAPSRQDTTRPPSAPTQQLAQQPPRRCGWRRRRLGRRDGK